MTEERPIEFLRSPADLAKRELGLPAATSQIQYVSSGYCLVIGDTTRALNCIAGLDGSGATIVHVDPAAGRPQKRLTEGGVPVFTVPELDLTGHLGAFRAWVPSSVDDSAQALDLGVSVQRKDGVFDVVLDLSEQPVMDRYLAPFGYVHAPLHTDVDAALQQLNELQGEFEKPRYFHYQADICAYSRSQLEGCHRCIEVCAAGAITGLGEGIVVDPFLCQGCGSCATVCPSGAMTYAYPRPADALERSRRAMQETGADIIVLHTESAQAAVEACTAGTGAATSAADALSSVQPAVYGQGIHAFLVEEVSAFGPDYWLAMLAGPARSLFLVLDSPAEDPGRRALVEQLQWTDALLAGLGWAASPVRIVSSESLQKALDDCTQSMQAGPEPHPVSGAATAQGDTIQKRAPRNFATHNDKRQTLRMALDELSDQFQPADSVVSLPQGAPFGQVNVHVNACTLCMACVSTCPAGALLDGQDQPALRFVEANCLQCGLCESACPESAITLEPRYRWDSVVARSVRTLHEEKPFHCLRCHTPFTTRAMIDNMLQKLSGHWMFQDEKAQRRLKLCGDCRVRDMFEDEAAGIAVHKDPS